MSQAAPTPSAVTSTATPASSRVVFTNAWGNTCSRRCCQCSNEPCEANHSNVATGASTPAAIRTAATSQPVPASVVKKARCRRTGEAADAPRADAGMEVPVAAELSEGVLVVEANPVDKLAGLFAMFSDFGQGQGIDHQLAEARHDGVELDAFLDRVLVVGLGVHALRLVGHQVFQQLDGLVAVWGMLGDGRARDVHVRTAALVAGEHGAHDLDGFAPFVGVAAGFGVLHATDVVGVGDANVANAAQNVTGHITVAAGGLAGQVVLEIAQPVFGCFQTVMGDHGRDQRRVVRVLPRADAHFALPARVGESFVGDCADIEIGGDVGDAIAQRQRVPLIVGATQMLGNGLAQYGGIDRLGDAGFHQIEQIADVDGHQDIGRRLVALGLHTLDQAVLHEYGVDLDAGVFGEFVEQRLDQTWLACGIQAYFLSGCAKGHAGKHHRTGQQRGTENRTPNGLELHGRSPGVGMPTDLTVVRDTHYRIIMILSSLLPEYSPGI